MLPLLELIPDWKEFLGGGLQAFITQNSDIIEKKASGEKPGPKGPRKKAVACFNIEKVAGQYAELYGEIIG